MTSQPNQELVLPQWQGSLVLGSGLAVFVGAAMSASSHRHSAVQFVRCRENPILFVVAGRKFEASAAIVAADVEHSFEASGGVIELLLIEPSGTFGNALNDFARRQIGIDLVEALNDGSTPPTEPDDSVSWGRALLASLEGVAPPPPISERRREVSLAVQLVTTTTGSVPRLSDVAAQVGLSPRQLSRSFAEQVGMPFRRFIVWNRVRQAVLALRSGCDLTTAAAAAGFADSAHFSRVFLSMFGIQPSGVLPYLHIAEADDMETPGLS